MTPGILTWQNFKDTVLTAGEERMHLVSETPYIALFADRGGRRIGMLIDLPENSPEIHPNTLRRFSVETLARNGRRCLGIHCVEHRYFQEAYFLFCAIADAVLVESMSVADAFSRELRAFQAIAEEATRLTLDRQVGLFGELLVLEQLIVSADHTAVGGWTGPLREPHDFRIGDIELEVKTTRGNKRIHTINGLAQTVASNGYRLNFLSIVLAPAGTGVGMSLPEQVTAIAARLANTSSIADFLVRLLATGFDVADAPLYPRRWTLRAPIFAVPVGTGFPAISKEILEEGMADSFSRLNDLSYSVSLEGLGSIWIPSSLTPNPKL
jgi:hypothetical protein